MATTIDKVKHINLGTSGVSILNTNSLNQSDKTDTSITIKHTLLNAAGQCYMSWNRPTLFGSNGNLKSITFRCKFQPSKESGHEVRIRSGTTSNGTDVTWNEVVSKTGLGASVHTIDFQNIGGSNFPLQYNDKYYFGFCGYKSSASTFYWYFTEIDIEVTYTVPAYTLTVASNNTAYGTVTGGGNYEAGTTATLKATPATGYKFKQWNDGNTSATRTVTVSADATYTATFELITYTATFKNHDGTVLETKSVSHGSTPSYTGATPTKPSTAQYTYTFSGWSPALSAITGDTTYTAQFTSTVRSYAITANAGTGGTVTGGGNYNYGSNATLTATANDGYKFKQWSDGNTSNPRTVSVTGAATYTAEFEKNLIKQVYVGTSLVEVYIGTSLFKEIDAGTSTCYES